MKLPEPRITGDLSVEQAISQRSSTRTYARGALSLAEVAQLLWAAQGETREGGYRSTPSAGALYPLELYLVAYEVKGLPAGVYRYVSAGHALEEHGGIGQRGQLAASALDQACVRNAPAVIVFTGVYARTMQKYGQRAVRYVHMEVGHAAQNVYLQATTLGLGTLMVGAFDDDAVAGLLGLPADHEPLALMPVGRR